MLSWERVEECAIETGIVDKLEVMILFVFSISRAAIIACNFHCFIHGAKFTIPYVTFEASSLAADY